MADRVSCPHGRMIGDILLCDLPCAETGAKEVWRTRDVGPKGVHEYIHEPWWCGAQCLWWKEHHKEK